MNAGFSVEGRHVVVVGAARSGVAAAELLRRRGARVTLTDLRQDVADAPRLREAGVTLELGLHDPVTLTSADLVVLSPGVPANQPAVAAARRAGVPVIGEVELAYRWLQGRVIAITGTKGKSTTTALTGRMFEAAGVTALVGGNIGNPLSAQVDASRADVVHVVEVSSFQLEQVDTFRPWIAVLLNFSPDHLDRHASVEEYASAKARIFARQQPDDWAVINADDPYALELARRGRARQLRFAVDTPLEDGVVVSDETIARRTGGSNQPLVRLSAVRLLGRHLLSDVVAATAVGSLAGLPPRAMERAVASFGGLEHVLEQVALVGGVRFVNDSKATNVVSARRAVESMAPGLVLIAGGRFKGGDLRDLREPLTGRAVAVVAIGEARARLRKAVGDVVPVHDAETMRAAVRQAFRLAPRGGTVLLAPACASFDMFRDYADRGRVFKEEVAALRAAIDDRSADL